MIGITLLGAGRIGRMHAGIVAATPGARLVAVYDVAPEAARAVANEHGAEAVASVEAALAWPGVDAILIASSTDTHVDLITAGAQAGKAVFCEKPIDLDIARVDACRAALEGTGAPIQIGFNRRFDPSFKAIRDAVQAGEIGEVRQVLVTSRDPDIPSVAYIKAAGGLLRDMTIHDFDLARYMLGEEPVEIVAMASALIDPVVRDLGEHDTAMVIMRTARGSQACITNYRRAVYGYDQRVEVVGEVGMLKAENRRATTVERWTSGHTTARDPLLHFFIERYAEAYRAQMAEFVDAVSNARPPSVGFDDGRRALLLADAAYASLREQRVMRVAP